MDADAMRMATESMNSMSPEQIATMQAEMGKMDPATIQRAMEQVRRSVRRELRTVSFVHSACFD